MLGLCCLKMEMKDNLALATANLVSCLNIYTANTQTNLASTALLRYYEAFKECGYTDQLESIAMKAFIGCKVS